MCSKSGTSWTQGITRDHFEQIFKELKLTTKNTLAEYRAALKQFLETKPETAQQIKYTYFRDIYNILKDKPETVEAQLFLNMTDEPDTPKKVTFHPESFSGLKNNVTEFINKFELYSNINGWDEEKKFLYFPAYLSDLALNIYYNMNKEIIKDWKTLKNQFLIEFNGSAYKDLAETKLLKRTQGKNESILEYLTDVVHLCKTCDDKMEEPRICKYILKGLKAEVLTGIGMSDNNTLSQLRANIQKYEMNMHLIGEQKTEGNVDLVVNEIKNMKITETDKKETEKTESDNSLEKTIKMTINKFSEKIGYKKGYQNQKNNNYKQNGYKNKFYRNQKWKKEGYQKNRQYQEKPKKDNYQANKSKQLSDVPYCKYCNRKGHIKENCRLKLYCKNCDRLGHETEKCRNNQKN